MATRKQNFFTTLTLIGGMTAASLVMIPAMGAESTATISGTVFEDTNRDGVQQADEPGWSNQAIWIHGPAGSIVDVAVTDAAGRFFTSGLTEGTHRARMSYQSWDPIKYEWVPTTTATLQPEAELDLSSGTTATFDLGWRPIAVSTNPYEPLTQATAGDGVIVQSFNDALTASQVLDALDAGSLRGAEAASTTVRFGYGSSTSCTTSISGSPGTFTNFSARCNIGYDDWLSTGDRALFHEYGHAWANYHDKVVQQDGSYSAYLAVRGLTGDDRLGRDHNWVPGEIIAEDFRQLFGSSTAAAFDQANREIPSASQVAGLRDWFVEVFMRPLGPDGGSDDGSGDPTPEPTPEPDLVDDAVIADMTGVAAAAKRGWVARVAVEVRDGDAPAPGETVTLSWEIERRRGAVSLVTGTCTSASDGWCTVTIELSQKVSALTVRAVTPSPVGGEEAVTVSRP